MSSARKPLIIAEKPSAARAIAEALGGFSTREGYLESPDFLLSWALGHLVEQMSPEEYDGKWKRWSLDSLPILPTVFGIKVVPKTKSQFQVLARLGKSAPELINACDAGREGELIFRYICQAAGFHQPARRLWVSSLTREAIREGFRRMLSQAEYERLFQSALCRAQGDWLVGMNGTRAFTVKWGELLSIGRVQTPTLALLARREREIEAFVPEEYWEVRAEFAASGGRKYTGQWFGPDGDRLKTGAAADLIIARCRDLPGVIESAEEKAVSERPPQLYDLTTLQRDANRRFGLTAAATLKAAQSLYEKKLVTYPRTDSRYMTRDMVPGLRGVLAQLSGNTEFRQAALGADPGLVHPGNRRVVDDTKVTDHHAIIPTSEKAPALSGVEAKVYGLIARRFIAQFYPEARFLEALVITRVGELPDRFRTKGRRMLEPGWRAVEGAPEGQAEAPARGKGRTRKSAGADDEEAEAGPIPSLSQGEDVRTESLEALQKQTQPPKRYSEAALLSAMEFAGKEMDDEALKEAMKGRGLGTPATRAAIIERLKDVGYITAEKKSLIPTPKGRLLVDRAEQAGAQVLLSAELTGEWEMRIANIQAGKLQPEVFMAQIRELAAQVVRWVREARPGESAAGSPARSGPGARRTRRTKADAGASAQPAGEAEAGESTLPSFGGKCPRCGRAVVKGSKGWLCANSDCSLRIPGYLCGKVVDAALAGALLTKGRTPLITGFKSTRTGNTFSAFLVLKDGEVGFEFPSDKPRRASGYRSSGAGARSETNGRTTAAKTGSRAAGSRTGAAGSTAGSAGAGVGKRTSRASKPAGAEPRGG